MPLWYQQHPTYLQQAVLSLLRECGSPCLVVCSRCNSEGVFVSPLTSTESQRIRLSAQTWIDHVLVGPIFHASFNPQRLSRTTVNNHHFIRRSNTNLSTQHPLLASSQQWLYSIRSHNCNSWGDIERLSDARYIDRVIRFGRLKLAGTSPHLAGQQEPSNCTQGASFYSSGVNSILPSLEIKPTVSSLEAS